MLSDLQDVPREERDYLHSLQVTVCDLFFYVDYMVYRVFCAYFGRLEMDEDQDEIFGIVEKQQRF